jgi:hypothetical protein
VVVAAWTVTGPLAKIAALLVLVDQSSSLSMSPARYPVIDHVPGAMLVNRAQPDEVVVAVSVVLVELFDAVMATLGTPVPDALSTVTRMVPSAALRSVLGMASWVVSSTRSPVADDVEEIHHVAPDGSLAHVTHTVTLSMVSPFPVPWGDWHPELPGWNGVTSSSARYV